MPPLPRKEDVVRVDRIQNPEHRLKGEGLYEWTHCKQKYYVDFLDLLKEIERVQPGRGEEIAERLMNFPRVFIVIPTGEVFSDTIPSEDHEYPADIMSW